MDWHTLTTSSVFRAFLDYRAMGLDVPADLLEALPEDVVSMLQQETQNEQERITRQGKRDRG